MVTKKLTRGGTHCPKCLREKDRRSKHCHRCMERYVPPPDPMLVERDKAVCQMRANGWKLQRIADRFGISRQRVMQILEKEQDHV